MPFYLAFLVYNPLKCWILYITYVCFQLDLHNFGIVPAKLTVFWLITCCRYCYSS